MAEDTKKMPIGAGLPEMPEEIVIAPKKVAIDWKRIIFILLGLALFFLFYFMSDLADAVDPSVWFIFGSVVMGLAFAVSGLTKRMAYKMLNIVGENTNFILLGTFLIIAGMTLLMAHTAVAAAIFPLLVAIHALYSESDQPTRFGKGLFIGMAWTAGAGSAITFLGSARAR